MKVSIKNIILLAFMLVAATLAYALRPTINMADERPTISLKALVPTAFGDWQEQMNLAAQIVDPQQKQMIDEIYSETLSRTYANSSGYRIMLSIAYGKNQSNALQLHKPEVCYPAQGFALLGKQPIKLDLQSRPISAVNLETSLGQRFEPITYWTVVGDHITTNQTNKKIVEFGYAMKGRIPDGMLVRISSIDKDTSAAYIVQKQFAAQLVSAIAPEFRNRFAGDPALQ